MIDLTDKTLVITGGNGGLGRAAVHMAETLGAKVVILDVAINEGVGSDNAVRHALDLLDASATKVCFENIGPIDGLLNIAGGFDMGDTAYEITDDKWQAMFDINVTTLRNAVAAAVPQLKAKQGGAIVNMGAMGAVKGGALMSAYAASKSAVMRLTESLSAELKGENINVNAVLPSIIDTPRNRSDMPDANFDEWVKPEQLASVILFLASPAASAVHGALVPVVGLVE